MEQLASNNYLKKEVGVPIDSLSIQDISKLTKISLNVKFKVEVPKSRERYYVINSQADKTPQTYKLRHPRSTFHRRSHSYSNNRYCNKHRNRRCYTKWNCKCNELRHNSYL